MKTTGQIDRNFDANFFKADWLADREQDDDPTNIDYIHVAGEDTYNPDCPACLRHQSHTDNEHYEAVKRVHDASSPEYGYDEMQGSFYEG